MRDPYKILGVRRDAAADEIKAAWRNMAKSAHPDHNQSDPTATARFAEIGRAYETLKDPRKRSLFDNAVRMAEAKKNEQTIMQQRHAAREAAVRAKAAQANAERVMEELARAAQKAAAEGPRQQAGSAEPADEMVERIFGAQARAAGGGQAQGRAQQAQYQQAQNQQAQNQQAGEASRRVDGDAAEADTKVDEEAGEAGPNAGANLPLPLSILTSLVRRFTGAKDTGLEKAPDEVATATVTIDDVLKSGWITASLPEGREIGFALPAGTRDGHELRLKGQGFKLPGMQRGDAVINIRIAPDPRFTVDGFDLHAVLPLSIENAVLGTEARIEGPSGPLNITVPAWSGSDKTISIPGQGLPREEGGRGDLVVELRIILWEKPDDKVTDLMRSMREGLFL
ncbi:MULTISPECIES: DnaJ C-terminal domain-containing protein [unclassified Rhizobium]|uniref:DnaJ C-terminal domain-containing protein n=1 Tax=unclassified Rhizobium TaxID=2613769 RepID=UPI001A9815B1|nr:MULTISPECIES: DnaJ C-terminal domain-containing protein [unclassified Rhizobium]MBX5160295.1 DnaJ domain-containing protein [Rhizobium sp. NZLR8]MBX5172531.1 DnaJ domain-containing protein [Rhizobium sp. NZLR1b]MBX5204247.1 DnaJ domain-containing protein [Rhizobium sp. NZLR1]MBX5209100.1 DnaJ domain-containing protein [Rhizobium sp. NZLR11]QSZ21966.1 DnaJ domain-containing protein [Rhizobium sp. NZLR1]